VVEEIIAPVDVAVGTTASSVEVEDSAVVEVDTLTAVEGLLVATEVVVVSPAVDTAGAVVVATVVVIAEAVLVAGLLDETVWAAMIVAVPNIPRAAIAATAE
jgi:hypothetical protein